MTDNGSLLGMTIRKPRNFSQLLQLKKNESEIKIQIDLTLYLTFKQCDFLVQYNYKSGTMS